MLVDSTKGLQAGSKFQTGSVIAADDFSGKGTGRPRTCFPEGRNEDIPTSLSGRACRGDACL